MSVLPFVYWKPAGSASVYEIQAPEVLLIHKPELNEEGFLIFPFEKDQPGYLFRGAHSACHKIRDIEITDLAPSVFTEADRSRYEKMIAVAVEEIRSGKQIKVVLARSADEHLPPHFNLRTLFEHLCRQYPQAFVYCLCIRNEVWLGASPEVLLHKKENHYLTYALAGTKSINSSEPFGAKEIHEQELVRTYIEKVVQASGAEQVEVSGEQHHRAGNLIHLLNEVRFTAADPVRILSSLHPTPAVCGLPAETSLQFIRSHEQMPRTYYSGYLGPVERNGNFSLWVNLRCARLRREQITYYAGAGIVEGSIPESEWEETEHKMNTLRQLAGN